ncbi:hypothetical protein [Alkalicoccobacillus murimartini]|uniref:Uncharacterized protein n=1 Tax=Alkalicoccobacillus murimartini TaxID=171685 RepID=A0ABT9YGI2_9BACI|nr:hypothetical protein [Alkalicoccobacillus murimartini]MDQ0206814.1 hypothetical protein [Alkalicoccobacillus murimartini]
MSFLVIIFGYISYQDKLNNLADGGTNSNPVQNDGASSAEPGQSDNTSEDEEDVEVGGLIENFVDGSETVQLAFFGSKAIDSSTGISITWPQMIENQLSSQLDSITI